MKRLLIISKQQFGTLTDVLKWSENLRHNFEVTVLCFNTGSKKVSIPGVRVIYVPYTRVYLINALLFYIYAIYCIFRSGVVLIEYFHGCVYLRKIFRNKPMLLDVRTLAVSKNESDRAKYNDGLIRASVYFNDITVVSEGVKEFFSNIDSNIYVMPLGADVISRSIKTYEHLELLYVGTLSGRDIEKTIEGFNMFLQRVPNAKVKYHILGDANTQEEYQSIEHLVEDLNLSDKVILYGRIPYDELTQYFDRCNVGISFVPITSYYDNQPVTKTFEYAMSGLVTIATATKENRKVITDLNGILINDESEDFAQALMHIYKNGKIFIDSSIRASVDAYNWSSLVKNNLLPILKKL